MFLAHVHISTGISKLGAQIPSISLPVETTCRPDAPCHKKCYAQRGRFRLPKCVQRLQTNLDIWQHEPQQYERDTLIAAFQARFFRWHSSGDIPDADYLHMMVRVAKALPQTSFLAFTKKWELVNSYLDTGSALPQNLKIVLSAWGAWIPPNPHNLPMSYIKFKKGECVVPPTARSCSQYCGDCVITGQSCWDLKSGESVYFCEH